MHCIASHARSHACMLSCPLGACVFGRGRWSRSVGPGFVHFAHIAWEEVSAPHLRKFPRRIFRAGSSLASPTGLDWTGLDLAQVRCDEHGRMMRKMVLTIGDVPLQRLLDSAFWFLIARLLVRAASCRAATRACVADARPHTHAHTHKHTLTRARTHARARVQLARCQRRFPRLERFAEPPLGSCACA